MDLNRLRYFLILSETEHLRQASRLLSISPAALSKAVKTLEEEFSQSLVEPEGRGLRLTEEGRQFAARIRPLVAQLEALEKTKVRHRKKCRGLRVASDPGLPSSLFADLHEGFFFSEPLSLKQMPFSDAVAALIGGEIDFAVWLGDHADPRTERTLACELSAGLHGREHLFANTPAADLPLADYTGSDPQARFHLPHIDAALEFCAQGKAAGNFPDFAVRLFNARHNQDLKLSSLEGERRTTPLFVHRSAQASESTELRKAVRALRLLTQNHQ
jgi:DNA-binding transcriptional LysR family regulator